MRERDAFSDLIRSIEENLQRGGLERSGGDGGDGGQGGNGPPSGAPGERRPLVLLAPLLLLLAFILFNRIIGFSTDWAWYDSLGLTSVFTTRITARIGLFVVGALVAWGFLSLNVLLARRIEPAGLTGTPVDQIAQAFGVRITPAILIIGAVFAFFMALTVMAEWEEVLVYLNQTDFGVVDPIFNRDISFFVFTLPIWQTARTWLMTLVILTLIAVAVVSGVGWRGWDIRRPILLHLATLGALALLLVAWQYRLDAWQLVYSGRGAVFGAGYTDVNAQLPAFTILTVVTLLAAVVLLVVAFLQRGWRAVVGVPVVWLIVSIVAGNIYPGLVQRFQVNPNELNLETPFIENNIEFTRLAFGLDDVQERDYDASTVLTADSLVAEPETVRNIRLWDYRPLEATYNQVQALRQYYTFEDIDIDRYIIDGERRQVMIAARELVPEQLNQNAQTWVNRKLVYTHGYGVAASPVAQVTRDGLPEFFIKDLPPSGSIPVERPQIYFGEATNEYVIGATAQPEFDYPQGDANVTTSFDADTGIDMSLVNRTLFALRFADINMLLNSDIDANSQLLWRRNIRQRVQEVAPFLRYDSDPYIVISDDGALFWIQDAYTFSNRYPYSQPARFPYRNPETIINYVRNPIKIVISAYDGSMDFYLVEPDEPIAATYNRIFPDLFTPFEEMPADLLDNIRYPNDFFSVQSEIFRTYHMTDVTEFYNKEDEWQWPLEIFNDATQPIEPYYVLMQLPGSDDLDFIQILPFTPANRQNMIAWLAAQNDPEKYGEKLVYGFGKDSLIFGPQQIEARINQDPIISAQLSLWNQQGSNVIRGNLIVIPIGDSLLYVEPLYLQADSGQIPELRRVVLATNDRVVMAENLGLALIDLFDRDVLTEAGLTELVQGGVGEAVSLTENVDSAQTDASATQDDGTISQSDSAPVLAGADANTLILLANNQFNAAQQYQRDGNWSAYGAEIESLQRTLEQLAQVSNVQLTVPGEEGTSDGAPLENAIDDASSEAQPTPEAGS